jgi:hypothetical protein
MKKAVSWHAIQRCMCESKVESREEINYSNFYEKEKFVGRDIHVRFHGEAIHGK